MIRHRVVICFVFLSLASVRPLGATDPPDPINPFKRSPFGAELEVYSGGITGQHLGAAYKTITRGDYGVRFTFGFWKALNFSLNYMYSNQTRTLTAVTPPPGTGLPTGTALLHAANLNVFFGNGEINLIRREHAVFYLSPGVGFARNGGRSLTAITPLGTASLPIGAGTAVSFNLGTGVKIYPWKHLGFRLDARDFVSGGGKGSLNAGFPQNVLCAVGNPNCGSPARFFGPVPVNNNLVFTLGLIFRIR